VKILYVSGETVPGNDGGAVHVREVAANLAALGHRVTVLCNRRAGQSRREMLDGVEIIRARMTVRGRTLPAMGAGRALGLLFRGFDLVMERYVTFGGAGVMLSMLKGIPLVLEVNSPHVEELFWRYGIRSRVVQSMLRGRVEFFFRRAKLVVSPLAGIVPPFARRKTKLVSWAANVERFRPGLRRDKRCVKIRRRHGLEGRTVVLFLGTFRKWHGVLRLPAVIESVAARRKDAKFLLVGKGECLEQVEREIARRGLADYAAVAGEQPYEDVPYFVAASDVGIAPYDLDAYEPLRRFGFYWSPLKIFELMAGGLPVVTIDVPPLNDIVVHGTHGLVVPQGDDEAMARAVADLLKRRSVRLRMGRAARKHVTEHYSWKEHAKMLNDLIARMEK